MSLISGLVGGTLEGIGGAWDHLTPGSGSSSITKTGQRITNPNVVLSNPVGLVQANNPAFTPVVHKATTSMSSSTSGANDSGTGAAPYGGTGGTAYGSGTSYSSGPSAADLAAYNTYNGQAHTALNDLLSAYDTANKQLKSQYGTQGNELQSGYNAAKNTYDTNVTQQGQQLQSEDNQIHANVANAYRNLLDMLGAYGGGASSVATQWAPTAAKHFQDTQVGGAQQNEAQNLKTLATNWGQYQDQFDNEKKKLADSQAQDLANNQANYDATKSQLNDILSSISTQAIDPTTIGSDLASIRASIPHTKFVKPSYTGVTPVYTAPSVSSFEASTPTTQVNLPTNNTAASTPALAVLLGQQKKDQNANITPAA